MSSLSPKAKFYNRVLVALIMRAEELGVIPATHVVAKCAWALAEACDNTWEDFATAAEVQSKLVGVHWDLDIQEALRLAAREADVPCQFSGPTERMLPVEPTQGMLDVGTDTLTAWLNGKNTKRQVARAVWMAMASACGRK